MHETISRRSFIKAGGVAAAGLTSILESGRAPAFAQGSKLHIVRWVDFVPAADEALRKQVVEAGKALGAEITLETINANDIQPRITAAISSGSGADIFLLQHNLAHLYERSLVDVGDIVEAIGKEQGGWYPAAEGLAKVRGTWRAVPHVVVAGLIAYRKSIFDEIGVKEFPKTFQAYREAGKKLKAKGYPIGQTLGHTFGDAPAFWYAYTWSFGGKEVERDGKVAINSKETLEGVKFAVGFWKDACDEGGLAWDDSNNNRAFLSGTISATLNGASIYIESLRNKEKYKTETGALMHTDIQHAALPAGPAGAFAYHTPFNHGVMSYSKNQKLAKDFLRWWGSREQFEVWFTAQRGFAQGLTKMWESHSMWQQDPVMLPFRDAAGKLRLFGHAGPANAKASEVYTKYIITDMYAKAVQGLSPEEAVKWAEGELKKIYG
jgi:multiple sugar transport system substrate-binding protein